MQYFAGSSVVVGLGVVVVVVVVVVVRVVVLVVVGVVVGIVVVSVVVSTKGSEICWLFGSTVCSDCVVLGGSRVSCL